MQDAANASYTKRSSQFSASLFLFLFLIALCVRGLALFVSLDSFDSDPDAYRQLAVNWHKYGVFGHEQSPTAFRPPLYPWTIKCWLALHPSNVPQETPSRSDALRKLESQDDASADAGRFSRFYQEILALSFNASLALWHWILGVAAVFMTCALARHCGLTPFFATFAAVLVAVDPILIQQSRLVMTETLATFLTATILLVAVYATRLKNRSYSWLLYALFGATLALASLCRPTFLVFAAFAFLALLCNELFVGRTRFARSMQNNGESPVSDVRRESNQGEKNENTTSFLGGCVRLVCFLVAFALVVAPWCVRNMRVFNKPILTTTHGGYTLLLANNEQIYDHYRSGAPFELWNPELFHKTRTNDYERALKELAERSDPNAPITDVQKELFQDQWTREKAIETIREQPKTFLLSCFIRVCELWRVLPQNVARDNLADHGAIYSAARYAAGVLYSFEFALAVLGVCALSRARRRRNCVAGNSSDPTGLSPWLWSFLLILSIQAPHLFYWTNMRMRAPIQIVVPIFVAYFLQILFNRFMNKNRFQSSN